MESIVNVELLFGEVLVLMQSATQFNTPATNRSSTTACRYYMAIGMYLFIMTVGYYLLATMPQLLSFTAVGGTESISEDMKNLSPPLLAALFMTLLLPRLPILSGMEKWFRSQLQEIADIPGEVRRLTAELRQAEYDMPLADQKRVRAILRQQGMGEQDVVVTPSPTPQYLWCKLSALISHLDEWERDKKFTGFLHSFADEWTRIREQYAGLANKARACFDLQRGTREKDQDPQARQAIQECQRYFVEHSEAVLRDLLVLISRGILHAHVTQTGRNKELKRLGYRNIHRLLNPMITLNQMVYVFLMISVIFGIGLPLLGRGHQSAQMPLQVIIMVATLYSASIFCVLYTKSKWTWAQVDAYGQRPWMYYLLVGGLAAVLGGIISLTFRVILFDWDMAIEKFLETRPWLLLEFATAAGTAFHLDNNKIWSPAIRGQQRWIESVSQALVTMAAAVVVHGLLTTPPPLYRVLILTGVIGALIGGMIPQWYRKINNEPVAQVTRDTQEEKGIHWHPAA
ncbi:MAG: hypothetical protein OEY80_04385 [Nitrospirota bacterium]|nr:hypothetical protein [Nitrospirota bacterium]